MDLKERIKRIAYGAKYSSESYIDYLRSIGVAIGDDCTIYVPMKTLIDTQYPWMIKIGCHVRITENVKILTHDYSWSVLKLAENSRGGVYGASGCVEIGDNVFIGMNSIITRNVRIGNNVIIGAGSVVTKDCEADSVYVGNPAHRIMSIEDFAQKRAKSQAEEAKILALKYYDRYGKKPGREIFHEYFMLFSKPEDAKAFNLFKDKMRLCGNFNESYEYLKLHPPIFENFEDFMRYCFSDE